MPRCAHEKNLVAAFLRISEKDRQSATDASEARPTNTARIQMTNPSILFIGASHQRKAAESRRPGSSTYVFAQNKDGLFGRHNDIRVRTAIVNEDVWPPLATEKPQVPDPNLRIPYSDEIVIGKLDVKDVIQPTYDEINKKYGLKEKQD